ncbi:conserved hypothetical protein [Vibrio chagasii]|nr:conserved hypothetical protein [Vibrio chagasii]
MAETKIEISLPIVGIAVTLMCGALTIVGGINAMYMASINGQLASLAESDSKHASDISDLQNGLFALQSEMTNAIQAYQDPSDYWASYYDDDGKFYQLRLHRAQFFKERKDG